MARIIHVDHELESYVIDPADGWYTSSERRIREQRKHRVTPPVTLKTRKASEPLQLGRKGKRRIQL